MASGYSNRQIQNIFVTESFIGNGIENSRDQL